MSIADLLSKTKWQKCIRCGQEVLTISSPDKALCGGDHCIEEEEKEKVKTYEKERIPDDVRWAVWERDNFTCKKCGSRKNLTVDHIYPEALGGRATLDNCQTLCNKCNSSKGKRL